MNQEQLFYWAYENYKKEFEGNRDDYLFKKGVNSKKAPKDVLTMVKVTCEIKEDWIAAIEKGLNYIQKAIKEDRQFIRNEGEVIPIEKVRRVSKDSIVDLSKHSNYITKIPEDGSNVVPEKLLMTKKENDYSIYENRVVFTTLTYLKNFVAERLEKIKDAVNKYEGTCQIIKTIELGYRTVDVNISLHDIRKNDPIAMECNDAQDKIKRLDTILNGILVLLKTPLMQEVSKAPMVTRPVTKTNVLKMNTNFKETLYIFDYVCAYNEPGFNIKEETKTIKPLSIEQENSFTDVILLANFLTYQYNNLLEDELKDAYLLEKKKRQEIKDNEILAKIQELLGKAKKSEKAIGEYLYLLEEGYRILNQRLEEIKETLKKTIDDYENKIVSINEAHQKEVDELNNKHQIELTNLETSLKEEFENNKNEIITKYEFVLKEKETTNINLTSELNDLKAKLATIEEKHQEEIKAINDELDLAHAENVALRVEKGKPKVNPRDYTSKERFDELEHELNVLNRFFEKAWKATKKEINKKHYQMMVEDEKNRKQKKKEK